MYIVTHDDIPYGWGDSIHNALKMMSECSDSTIEELLDVLKEKSGNDIFSDSFLDSDGYLAIRVYETDGFTFEQLDKISDSGEYYDLFSDLADDGNIRYVA